MNRERYEKTIGFFKNNKTAYKLLWFIYKVLPNVLFIAYPALLAVELFLKGADAHWVNLGFFPFMVLVLVSVVRFAINEQRPYERYGIDSVFHKTTSGKSMPSRHTACAFIIAMTFLYVNIPLGILMMTFAVLIGASRVLAGAHYIRDVLVGAAIGTGFGMLYYTNFVPMWGTF